MLMDGISRGKNMGDPFLELINKKRVVGESWLTQPPGSGRIKNVYENAQIGQPLPQETPDAPPIHSLNTQGGGLSDFFIKATPIQQQQQMQNPREQIQREPRQIQRVQRLRVISRPTQKKKSYREAPIVKIRQIPSKGPIKGKCAHLGLNVPRPKPGAGTIKGNQFAGTVKEYCALAIGDG